MGAAMKGSRARRLFDGWGANLAQLVLGITQQVGLVPVFLYFTSSAFLAAWLALYAAGSLVALADSGLHSRSLNRFLSFKSSVDPDGRTARYYAAMLRLYVVAAGLLIAASLAAIAIFPPSRLLGFPQVPHFDAAFAVMVAGMLATLPSSLVAALYRARGLYGRGVWIPCAAQAVAQVGQVVSIVTTGDLLTIAICYVAPQILLAVYLMTADARRCFPFLHAAGRRAAWSWRWAFGQYRLAFPFAIASGTEIALQNLSVLLVSALVFDRVAVAQWGVTRVVAGLLRAVCTQLAQPLAIELGHDYAVGNTTRLRSLYARGSVLLTLLTSVLVSGLLAFWPDFFALWTRGTIPYDARLTFTLLIGTGIAAPAMLALGYCYCSDRGRLLARVKAAQLTVFLVLALLLTPRLGPLGMAIAVVASDLLVQFGWLGLTVLRQTLASPLRHILFLALIVAVVMPAGWLLGTLIRSAVPGAGLAHFVAECAVWLVITGVATLPFLRARTRARLEAVIPN
jgi:O-antigen/teichoic acid export membrane protein